MAAITGQLFRREIVKDKTGINWGLSILTGIDRYS